MKIIVKSKKSIDSKNYASPACQEILLGTHNVFCVSATEKVGEIEGEW